MVMPKRKDLMILVNQMRLTNDEWKVRGNNFIINMEKNRRRRMALINNKVYSDSLNYDDSVIHGNEVSLPIFEKYQ